MLLISIDHMAHWQSEGRRMLVKATGAALFSMHWGKFADGYGYVYV